MRKYTYSATAFLLLLFLLSISQTSQAEDIRDYYAEPGINPFKESINQNFHENIDPFSGTLQLKYTDISIPGNGGMDININRVYTSIQTNTYPMPSVYGFGWTMNFGRIVVPKLDKDKICNQSAFNISTKDNPSLELPDGGRELLVLNDINSDGSLITKSNWKANCVSNQQGMVITSPSGIKYTMDRYELYQQEPSWFTTKIEDLHGNWITIDYATNPTGQIYITDIFRSEEGTTTPAVHYEYEDADTANIRLTAITANNQRWEYRYQTIDNLLGGVYRQLTEVVRPDGTTWEYQYYPKVDDPDPNDGINEDGLGSYSLQQVTYPYGTAINYTYQYVQFAPDSSLKTTSIHTKTVSGNAVEDGQWTYTFEPFSFAVRLTSDEILRFDTTTIQMPKGSMKLYHYGLDYNYVVDHYVSFRPSYVGLLYIKETYAESGKLLQRLANNWGTRKISNEQYWHGRNRSWWFDFDPSDGSLGSFAPILLDQRTARDIVNPSDYQFPYLTQYSQYDAYGNAGKIVEQSSLAGTPNKEIINTYHVDIERWVVSQLEDETFYEMDGNAEKQVGKVDRTINSLNQLTDIDENGVKTHYTYYSTGDLESEQDANNHTTWHSDYKRGIARRVDFPEGISISREVNTTGTLKSVTDGRNHKTSYEYDGLNRLKTIDYPIHSDVSITYTPQAGTLKRTLTRGNYQSAELINDFGQTLERNQLDQVSGKSITITYQYDALSRQTFTSLPNRTNGISLEYDALGRTTLKTNPDQSKVTYYYADSSLTITNERGFDTKYGYLTFGADFSNDLLVYILAPENVATAFGRDIFGKTTSIFQGTYNKTTKRISGYEKTFSYDSRHFLVKSYEPETGTTIYVRDAIGNVLSEQLNNNPPTKYVYDDLYRLRVVDYPGMTPDIEKFYDENGSLVESRRGKTKWIYGYDENDNLTSEQLTISDNIWPTEKQYNITYHINDLDHIYQTDYPDGLEVDFAPDNFGRPTKAGEFASNILYHPDGQIESYTLDALSKIKSIFGDTIKFLPIPFCSVVKYSPDSQQ